MPAPQVQRLIQGLGGSPVPILSVDTDTYTTATNVNAVQSTLAPEDNRKVAAALGIVEASVSFDELQGRLAVSRTRGVTPLMFEYELIQRARANRRAHCVARRDRGTHSEGGRNSCFYAKWSTLPCSATRTRSVAG